MGVGLFADWRDISFNVDFQLATTLGTVLQVSHKILHRQWSVFNALRKPERTVVNVQPLDFTKRAGFVHLGENLWHGGDRLVKPEPRGKVMDWARQPANFTIEQQDEETWWIIAAAAYDGRPTNWMRAFVFAFREALLSFLFDPIALVHGPLPDDDVLLRSFEEDAAAMPS